MHDAKCQPAQKEPEFINIAHSFSNEMVEKFDGSELTKMMSIIKDKFSERIEFLIRQTEENKADAEERIQMLKDNLSLF